MHVTDQAAGYATFAAQGVEATPYIVAKVVRGGRTEYQAKPRTRQAFPADVSADTTYAMQQVITSGTGTRARLSGGRPAAGKTGTTDASNNVWFCGFTPQLAAAVWFGYGDPSRSVAGANGRESSGGAISAPVWKAFMDAALKGQPVQALPKRADVGRVSSSFGVAPTTPPPTRTATPSTTPSQTPSADPSATPTTGPDRRADRHPDADEDSPAHVRPAQLGRRRDPGPLVTAGPPAALLSAEDPLVAGVTTAIGGPPGRRALLGERRLMTPLRWLVLLTLLTSALGFWQKAPCREHGWTHDYQYTRACYSDVLALYYSEQLDRGARPYLDHPVEYPVVIGAAMAVVASVSDDLARALPGGRVTSARARGRDRPGRRQPAGAVGRAGRARRARSPPPAPAASTT